MNSNAAGCVFCGKSPVTSEHVFSSKWLESLMPHATSLTTSVFRTGQELKTFVQHPKKRDNIWRGAAAINCACNKCNSGWMARMDEGVKEVLTPLANGEVGTIEEEGVRALAIWATKVALVLDSSRTPASVDSAVKHAFRKRPSVLNGSTIWLGAMSPTDESVRVHTADLGPVKGTEDGKAFVATFRVIHLVVQVIYPLRSDLVLFRGDAVKPMLQLWPRSEELAWPPPRETWLTSEDEFMVLANSYRGGLV